MKVKDEIIEEIWDIKDSLASESGGDLRKLAEIIKADVAKIDKKHNTRKRKTA